MASEMGTTPESTQWTLNHKVTEPFIFRSGDFFGFGKKAWTIRSAIKYMDRHPEAGIYHLENGTLSVWLENQHGEAVADLARAAARNRGIDARSMLETFLLGTGLVRRPRMVLRPRKLGPVYILSGQKAELLLHIRQGRGRGHLFGTLRASEPRVRIEPSRFGGKKSDIIITLDTSNLPISSKLQESTVLVDSSATEEPLAVPIRFKVVSKPAPFTRWIIRPFVAAVFAGILGAVLGTLLGRTGVSLPAWGAGLLPNSSVGAWSIIVGIVWGILGGIRGLFQPLSWPIYYALRRCLARLLVWTVVLGVIVTILTYGWQHTTSLGALPFGLSGRDVFLLALIFAIVPAELGEIWSERSTRRSTVVQSDQPLFRPGILMWMIVLSAILALGAINVGNPFIGKLKQPDISREVRAWGETHLQELEKTVNSWVDRATVRYFDRRAPSHTPTPTPHATDQSNS